MEKYNHKKIEKKWQEKWRESKLYRTGVDASKPKTYVLDMFPYPSGEGLHVGHPKGYIATDIYSRYKRMQGHNVLHPMGWDAFGLPAENYAIKNKIHPRVAVEKNIANFKAQLAGIGFDYDWEREINTTDPEYYKWTQWIFLQLYKKGLAYQSNEPINWCPSCMTGLANEDLDGTACERCGTDVVKKRLPQWVLKITDYADRMLKDLDTLDWPEHIKTAQRNWIGKSEGVEIDFAVKFIFKPEANSNSGSNDEKTSLTVFTTRPDTLFGATYLVLAPEHVWITLATDEAHDVLENKEEVLGYIKAAARKTDIERAENKEKTGVELKGVTAINPANGEEIPIYVADYVLAGYGTGAIMAVPAHDERDFEFARKFNIPIRQVIVPCSTDAKNPPQLGFEEVKRNTVIVHVHNKATGKYALLDWHGSLEGITTAIMGGVEVGQTPEDAAIAEIREEAGLTHATIIKAVPWITAARYCASHKNQNRTAHTWGFLAEIENLENQGVIDPQEQSLHTLVWVEESEIMSRLTPDHQKQVWRLLHHNEAVTGAGYLINSGPYNGLDSEEAKAKITALVGGRMTSTYKIKDWVFSRQRYWGEPIPIIHCQKDGAVAVPDDQLPVLLPEVTSYEPSGTGESPLATITDWVNTSCPTCGGPAKRETNTMPQWAGSSWYYLRFMDSHNAQALVDPDIEKRWAPVDVYVGGDHAVRHLIYARFWHKFLYDIGSVSTVEPFARLEFLGFILAEDGRKMSKRYGNVINPTDVVANYGADAFRVYEMFMGPFENTVAWSTASIAGTTRFVERVWRLQAQISDNPTPGLESLIHQTIKKVGEDIEGFKFNTAISQMMILLNATEKEGSIGREQWGIFLKLLAPFAPHSTDELWERSGHVNSIHVSSWPVYDSSKLVTSGLSVAVQINGKVRGTVSVTVDTPENEVLSLARAHIKVAEWLKSGVEKKVIYIHGRVVNFVIEVN